MELREIRASYEEYAKIYQAFERENINLLIAQ